MKKCLKKVFAVVLVIAVVLGSVPLNGFKGVGFALWNGICSLAVSAKEETEVIVEQSNPTTMSDNTLASTGRCGDNVYWTFDEEAGALTISGEGEMYYYYHFVCSPFYNEHSIKSVFIGEGVSAIIEGLFGYDSSVQNIIVDNNNENYSSDLNGILYNKDKTELMQYPMGNERTSFTIPDNVTSIGNSAFCGCSSLTSIEIPDGVTSIGNSAFYNCSSLTSINIPESVTSIGDWAFYDCGSLTSIEIPDGVTSIGNSAFCGCSSLTSIEIPDGVTSIGNSAFYGCSSLTSVEFLDSPATIGNNAFEKCYNLTSISLGNNIKSIGYMAFHTTGYFKDSKNWDNGSLYIGRYLIRVDNNYIDSEFKIRDDTLRMADYAFYRCRNLIGISIPDTVRNISYEAFFQCSNLNNVQIGNGVFIIDGYAFYDCTRLTSIEIPDSVTRIGSYAFYNCSSLTSIEIPDGVTSIGSGAFDGCSKLTTVTIGNGVTSIGEDAFSGCRSLTSIEIPDSVTSIGSGAFDGCSSLTSINIPNSVTSIGSYAFSRCKRLESVSVGNSVLSIGRDAFQDCVTLSNVNIKSIDSWIQIDFICTEFEYENSSAPPTSNPLHYAKNLLLNDEPIKNIKISDGVKKISPYAFYQINTLESIQIPKTIESIGTNAFYGCENLNFVIAEDIGTWCEIDFSDKFSNPMCYAKVLRTNEEIIYDLIVPDKVEKISSYAFYGCQFLKSVTVPDSVKSIGNCAFYDCSRLISASLGDGVETIGGYAFCCCTNMEEISFGTGLRSVGSNAFYDGRFYYYYESDKLNKVNVKDITSWLKIDFAGGKSNPLYRAQNLYVNGVLAEEITVDGVDIVKKNTFCNCTSIKSVTIGDMVKEIDDNAFSCCSNLKTLKIGSNVERIGSYAFLNCDITGSLNIPGNVKTVGYQTFNKNSHLTSINISDGVETIGENAFANCSSLVNVSVPASVTTMGYGAFYKSSQITDVYYAKTKSEWEWLGGTEYFGFDYYKVNVHFSAPCATNGHTAGDEWVVLIPATKYQTGLASRQCTVCGCMIETKVIPRNEAIVDPPQVDKELTSGQCGKKVFWSFDNGTGTLTISGKGDMYNYYRGFYSPFYSNSSVKIVVVESGVTGVGNSAFSYCSNLTSVLIPESVTRIGQYAFYECDITGEFVIPSSVDTVGYQAFEKNRNLESLTLSEVVRVIGENAFALCENLKTVTVPSSINTLNYGTFYGCGSITDVYYSSSIYGWENLGGTEYFGLDMNKVSIHFAQKIASGRCGENVYWELDCETGSLTISGTGDMYDDNFNWSSPFRNKKYIKTLTIQPNVTRIGDLAFPGCTFLTSITISDSVTSIGSCAFQECSSLTNIKIPDSVTSIGGSAFTDCSSLTSITIPSSVKTIESGAFEGCDIIKDVYFGGSCSDWGNISIGGRNMSLRNANIHYASHSYEPITTNPTCTQKGYTTYTCSVCGDSYVDDYTGALGHMPGEWVVTVVPTEQFEGIKTMYCPVCCEFIQSEVIPKTTSPAFVSSVSVSDVVIEYKSFSVLTPQITADEGAKYTVSYTSSDPSIVSVDQNGRVYGEKKGSANITVTVTDSNGNAVTDTCKVSVEYSWWQWIIMTVLFGWLWY